MMGNILECGQDGQGTAELAGGVAGVSTEQGKLQKRLEHEWELASHGIKVAGEGGSVLDLKG